MIAKTKKQVSRDEASLDEPAYAKAQALYDIIRFKNQLNGIDRLTWSDYLQIVTESLLPFAFAMYCFDVLHFGANGCLMLSAAA